MLLSSPSIHASKGAIAETSVRFVGCDGLGYGDRRDRLVREGGRER